MIETRFATEQHKGWWYALKCTTLFGFTILTEYVCANGYAWSGRDNTILQSDNQFKSQDEALDAIREYKKRQLHLSSIAEKEAEFKNKNTPKQWVDIDAMD